MFAYFSDDQRLNPGGTSVRLFTSIVLQLFFVIAAQAASVTTDSNHYAPGSTAVATVSGGPGNAGDWVALYAVGATNYDYEDWRYLNREYTQPSQGQSSATISLVIPQDEGQYEVRFLLNDGYDTIAISQSFQVGSNPLAIVAKSGGDYPDPHAALRDIGSWCGIPSETNPCLIEVMPGDYNVSVASIALSDYVHLRGSGSDVTILTGGSRGDVVVAAGNTSVRDITIFVERGASANGLTVTGTNVWVEHVAFRSPRPPLPIISRRGLHLLGPHVSVTARSLFVDDGFTGGVRVEGGGELSLRGFDGAHLGGGISVGSGTVDIAEAKIDHLVADGLFTRVFARSSVVDSASALNGGYLRLSNSEIFRSLSVGSIGMVFGQIEVFNSQFFGDIQNGGDGSRITCIFTARHTGPLGPNCLP